MASNEVGGVAARRQTDCQALVVAIKVVVQPVCGHTHIQQLLDAVQKIYCDGMCGE